MRDESVILSDRTINLSIKTEDNEFTSVVSNPKGCLDMSVIDGEAKINTLHIYPDLWIKCKNHASGAQLLTAAEMIAQRLGATVIYLDDNAFIPSKPCDDTWTNITMSDGYGGGSVVKWEDDTYITQENGQKMQVNFVKIPSVPIQWALGEDDFYTRHGYGFTTHIDIKQLKKEVYRQGLSLRHASEEHNGIRNVPATILSEEIQKLRRILPPLHNRVKHIPSKQKCCIM